MGGKGNAVESEFYGGSNLRSYGIPEFTEFSGTVCTAKYGVSHLYCCMFCEVQMSLVSGSCEYSGSVTSYLLSSVPLVVTGADCM